MSIPLSERVVALAAEQVGMKETGPNAGPPVDKFAGGRSEPWCAHFVAWLFRECGRPLPGDVIPSPTRAAPLAGCAYLWSTLSKLGYEVDIPKAGDVFVWKARGKSDRGPGWHTGIVTGTDGVLVQVISGNYGDAVKRHSFFLDDPKLVGFLRVPEAEA